MQKYQLRNFFYTSIFYNKFLNKTMKHGKKERFEIILLKVFLQIARYSKISPFWYFFEILEKQRIYVSFKRRIRKRKLQYTPFALRKLQQY